MSKKNANVFYEVGIAHSFRDSVILLTQDTDDIPFDLRHLQAHLDEPTPSEGLTCSSPRSSRRSASKACLQNHHSMAELPAGVRILVACRDNRLGLCAAGLRACEGEWADEVVPAEAKKFYERFPALHNSPSISFPSRGVGRVLAHPPADLLAALAPGGRVLAFEVIRPMLTRSGDPELMLALERAYTLWERITPQQPNTITTAQPLLALRTWTLWGAAALGENWQRLRSLFN